MNSRENVDIARLQSVTSNVSSRTNDSSVSDRDTSWDFEKFPDIDVDPDYVDESDASENRSNAKIKIPFSSVHNEPVAFDSAKRKCFLPGKRITVEVVGIECPDTGRIINPNVYVIDVTHGDYQWTVRRRHKHFRHLHEQMVLLKARLQLPIPSRSHQERRKSYALAPHRLPSFPKTPDYLVDDFEKRKHNLTRYVQSLLRSPLFRKHPEMLKFLEVSNLSFVTQLGDKWKEGMVMKRSGGHKFKMGWMKDIKGCVGGCHFCRIWQQRWLLLKDTFVAYIDPEKGSVRDVILMDRVFKVRCGKDNTSIRHGLVISNMNRKLSLHCWTHRKAKEWVEAIDKVARERATDFTKDNRYDSFAPVRDDSPSKWYADGATYMAAAADALESAQEEIFITDWWLSPEVFMKRPIGDEGAKWRLDVILKRKADAGVKVFVMLYKEMQVALGINSYYTKETLQKLNPENIKVLRHPDGITLWSHHEKTVIIDQRIAFLGGIDLCYGRWDTPNHRLVDLGSLGEYMSADDVMSTNPENIFNKQKSGIDSVNSPLGVIPENPSVEGAYSFRPKQKFDSDGIDEPDRKNNSIELVGNGKLPSNEATGSVAETRFDGLSPDWQISPVSRGEGSSSDESSEDTPISEFSDSDLESPHMARKGHSKRTHVGPDGRHKRSHAKPKAISLKDRTGAKIVNTQHGVTNKQQRTKQYSRSASLPAEVEFSGFSKTIAPPAGFNDLPSIPDAESDTDNSDMCDLQSSQNSSQLATISSLQNSTTVAGPPARQTSQNSNSSSQYMAVPQIVVEGASDTEEIVSRKSSNSPDVQPNRKDTPSLTQPKSLHSKKKKHARQLPQVSTSKEVIRYATPYEEPPLSDVRESFTKQDKRVGVVNSAFQDSTVSDSRDVIVYDPVNLSYTNAISDSDGASTGRDENYNDTNILEAADLDQPQLLKVKVDTDAVSVGEPQSFKAFLQELKTADRHSDTDETGRAVWLSPRDESGREEEEEIKRALRKENKKKKSNGLRNKLTRTKAVETTPACSSSESEDEDRRKTKGQREKRDKKKGGKGWDRVRKMHQKKMALDAFSSPSATTQSQGTPTIVLDPNSLSVPGRQRVGFATDEKPSTPKPKRKMDLILKTHNLRQDIRKKFQSKRSRSMGVDLEEPVAVESLNFRDLRENKDDIINKLGEEESYKLWIGKDYTNFIFKDFVDLDQPFTDFIDRKATPRMPWHDIGVVVYGKAARDVSRHFIQRWNFTKLQKRKDNSNYPMLLPKAYHKIPIHPTAVKDPSVIWCKTQILRSSSHWSAGLKFRECSIQNAYVDLIKHAQHYIYIENQFFVSIMNDNTVTNNIAGALYERILSAHNTGEAFRVYVVLPLLPAFEGELGTARGTSIQAVTHWNYSSICRGGKSLLERLTGSGVLDPFQYISFYGLRNHGNLNNNLVSELVYVHSKMMIVDDRQVIIGSANINDRSLNGKRDSELAVVVEDTQMLDGVMNGQKYRVGKFAHSMRTSLFKEHLGWDASSTVDINDPVCRQFYKGVWMKQAAINTHVYEKVFRCLPTDNVTSFQQLKEYQKESGLVVTDRPHAEQLLKRVQGHLVIMPLQFLSKEASLAPAAGTIESIAPTIIWT